MSTKAQQMENRQLVLASFEKVTKLEYVKEKWVSIEIYIQLIREYNRGDNSVFSLTDSQIKNILIRSKRISESDSDLNPNGFYLRKRRPKKRQKTGGNTQPIIQAIYVTTVGQKPPRSYTPWYDNVITALPRTKVCHL